MILKNKDLKEFLECISFELKCALLERKVLKEGHEQDIHKSERLVWSILVSDSLSVCTIRA